MSKPYGANHSLAKTRILAAKDPTIGRADHSACGLLSQTAVGAVQQFVPHERERDRSELFSNTTSGEKQGRNGMETLIGETYLAVQYAAPALHLTVL